MLYTKILNTLKNNNIAIVPTDTIYGLCCNALNEEATKKLFYIKKRPLTKTIAIAVKDKNDIYNYTQNICPLAKKIIDVFLPGPLTLILDTNGKIKNKFLIYNNTIAIRVPENHKLLHILQHVDFPLALTSANIHNNTNCTNITQVLKQLPDKIEYIDDGECKYKQESTIISFQNNKILIQREGVIKKEKLLHYTSHLC